jgi:magnesium chelatase subunit H
MEDKRVRRFGSNRNMWDTKAKQNTPEGLSPKRWEPKIKTVTPDDDKFPPSYRASSPGTDIIARKGFIGNVQFLKGDRKGDSNCQVEHFASFPPPGTAAIVADVIKKTSEWTKEPLPHCVAFTLWATDNVNTYGKSMAEIFAFIGVRLVKDTVDEVELIPLKELGRPRIDVVVSCSGGFRDLFMKQMSLMDTAIKMAAEAKEPPEMNFVRKHAFQMTQECSCTLREAATRVFSNAAGSYSANISAWVKSNEWESETQLQRQFLARKCHAFNSDKPGMMEYKSEIFKAALRNCDVTVQNLDLNDILSITDVPHYYDADPTKVIAALRFDRRLPICLLVKTTVAGTDVHTLSETIRIDSMSKILSPDYYEKILKQNYDGVKEISNCLRNMLGWAVTSGNVDTFLFEIASSIFMEDKEMCTRLRKKDNASFRNLLATFVKAGEQRYWDTSDAKIRRLRELKKFAESALD